MAKITVSHIGLAGGGSCNNPPADGQTPPGSPRQPMIPIDNEQWGLHGPVQTKWVEKHVYWVLPLGTQVLTFLILSTIWYWTSSSKEVTPLQTRPAGVVTTPAPAVRQPVARRVITTPAVTYSPPPSVTVTQTVTIPPKVTDQQPAAEAHQETVWGPPTTSPH